MCFPSYSRIEPYSANPNSKVDCVWSRTTASTDVRSISTLHGYRSSKQVASVNLPALEHVTMAQEARNPELDFHYRCHPCNLVIVGAKQFSLHFRRVGHDFPIQCGRCVNLFAHVRSLLRHIRDTHIAEQAGADDGGEHNDEAEDNNIGAEDNNEAEDNNQGEVNIEGADGAGADGGGGGVLVQDDALFEVQEVDLTRSAATMILNLRQSVITTASIQRIQDECFKLMTDTSNSIKAKVVNFLRNENMINLPSSRDLIRELELSDPFLPIRSLKQQLSYFAREMGLVIPVPMFLDWRPDFRLNPETNQYEPTQVPMTFQYIPFKETVKLILSNRKLRDLIESEQRSQDGVLRSYLDGIRALANALIQKYPITLRIQLYWDDLEVVNPLGSKTSIHKLAAFYFSLQNIPPVENSQLSSVYLLTLAYSEDVKSMKGFTKILEPFLRDLKEFEREEGVVLNIGDELVTVRATLTVLCADTAAAHDILGFLSPSARHFCRVCMVSRQELHRNCNAVGERRTPESFAAHVEQVKARPAFSTECGVKRSSPLSNAKYFSVTDDAVFDIFHDLAEGVSHLIIILALYQFTQVDKFFSVSQFNARVNAFNYGIPDRKNKPSVNISEESLKNKKLRKLNQSGSQMLCLTRVFGFLVPEVPEDHPHLRLVNMLQEIQLISFSREIRLEDNNRLGDLITSHNDLFQALHIGEFLEEDDDQVADDPEENNEPAGARVGVYIRPDRPVKPINKLHHLTHLKEFIEKFGPLILYWCARYEGRHHIFCKFAAICCNFMNLPKTMAEMHQISTLSGFLKTTYRADEVELHSSTEIAVEDSLHAQLLLAHGLEGDTIIFSVQSVVIAGEDFRPGLFVIADTSPCFAIIQHIYVHEEKVYFVIMKWETEQFVRRYCAYRVKPNPNSESILLDYEALAKHGSYAPWNPFNQRVTFISPRFLIF